MKALNPIIKYTYFFVFIILLMGCQTDSALDNQEEEKEEETTPPQLEFKIIEESDPKITTHHLKSGNSGFQIGITSNGGGIINEMIIPGFGDIMGIATDQYGRAGQVAIRDQSHSGRYNPTQAGHHETLGTKCVITETDGKLVVEPRGMSLWHGDKGYDFTRWENIGPDAYVDDGGNSDIDGLDEENLEGKMETEVFSEFDYYGTYEDYHGKNGITAGIIYHYYQISFIRPPGHCINQFRDTGALDLTPWNPNKVENDISVNAPAGVHKGTDKDLSNMIGVWSIRNDSKIWLPKYVYYRTNSGEWRSKLAADADEGVDNASDDQIFINTDGNDDNTSKGICLYRPRTDTNENAIIGINEVTGNIVYKDDRFGSGISYTLARIKTLTKFGFLSFGKGMINRTRLEPNIYEAYRNEVFILYGSPKEIMDSVALLDDLLGI
jgi:hypothetical protein